MPSGENNSLVFLISLILIKHPFVMESRLGSTEDGPDHRILKVWNNINRDNIYDDYEIKRKREAYFGLVHMCASNGS